MNVGDVIFASGPGRVDLAQASPSLSDDDMKQTAIGVVTNVNGSAITYRNTGVVENPNWTLVTRKVYFLSPDVPGGITTEYPTADGQYVIIVGTATSPTQLALNIHWMVEQS